MIKLFAFLAFVTVLGTTTIPTCLMVQSPNTTMNYPLSGPDKLVSIAKKIAHALGVFRRENELIKADVKHIRVSINEIINPLPGSEPNLEGFKNDLIGICRFHLSTTLPNIPNCPVKEQSVAAIAGCIGELKKLQL